MRYDLILTGGGMAGLSFLYQLRQAGLTGLRVLILDREEKRSNDRTWCYWETGTGPFEAIVYRSWDQVRVHGGPEKPLHLPLRGYRYKMIRGIDFYRFMDRIIREDPMTERRVAELRAIRDRGDEVEVETDQGTFKALQVMDSTWRPPMETSGRHHLLQHFFGKVIVTPAPVFDPVWPDLMHFGIPQENQCRFMYILPLAPDRALVEFTVFSESLLDRPEYEQVLDGYVRGQLGQAGWEVEETEFGVIPMTDEPIREKISGRVMRIGTAGGYTNPATGFTFARTQKRIAELVRHFRTTGQWDAPRASWQWRFGLYAAVMLNVLEQKRAPAPELFYDLYRKNPIDRVFRFLDGESSFGEEVRLMQSMAIRPFLLAAADVLRRRIF